MTKIAVILVATLMIMQTCGFQTGPLIAGAGVAGLAISFGAQNLIRDYISWFFILVENQYKVGDGIKAAGVSGQVEDMNLRVTVLRDLEGVAHFIPSGEIKVVSNLAKGWSRAVVNVGIAYKGDLDRVITILKEVGDQLAEDSRFGPHILSSPEVLGVESLEESRVVLRVLANTRALKQWEIARELRRRIRITSTGTVLRCPVLNKSFIQRNRLVRASLLQRPKKRPLETKPSTGRGERELLQPA